MDIVLREYIFSILLNYCPSMGPTVRPSAIFIKEIASRMHSDPYFGRREGGVSYIDVRERRLRDAVPAFVLRKNFPNGVPS
jgi:hypothetical protein